MRHSQQRGVRGGDVDQRDWALLFVHHSRVSRMARKGNDAAEAPRGPWHLGRFGPAINLVAIVWVIFITVILSLPDDMRAGKSMAVVTLVLAIWYVARERHRFRGPAWAFAAPDAVSDAARDEGTVTGGDR